MHSVESMKDMFAWEMAIKPTMTPTGQISDGHHTFDELYEHRHALFFALMLSSSGDTETWMSKLHDDGSSFDGWFIAGMGLSTGPITYHLPMRLWDRFVSAGFDVLEKAPKWDGHTSNDVINRLVTADWHHEDDRL